MIRGICYQCGSKKPALMVSWGVAHVFLNTRCLKDFMEKWPAIASHQGLIIEETKNFKDKTFAYPPSRIGAGCYKVGCKNCPHEELTENIDNWKCPKCSVKK